MTGNGSKRSKGSDSSGSSGRGGDAGQFVEPPPAWWSPARSTAEVLRSLAATPGPAPSTVAGYLADGRAPATLLRSDSPDPRTVDDRLQALGQRFLDADNPEWPFAKVHPEGSCAWLFATGLPLPPLHRAVAIVGSRQPSALRADHAHLLAASLAAAGCPIVSGGAVGIDAAAHRGAVEAGGTTIAVLGCGLDVPYPSPNQRLFQQLRDGAGTLLSEFPPGTQPGGWHFPVRNRLIAALAAAVVVVAANERSGSLTTARYAAGRGNGLVFAMPGAPWDDGATGCNDLLRDGAVLARGPEDILAELDGFRPSPLDPAPGAGGLPVADPLRPDARQVMDVLVDGTPISPSRLARLTRLDPPRLAIALLELELAGLVERASAGIRALGRPR